MLNWRKWFLARRAGGALAALQDRPRAGRPPLYDAPQQAQMVAGVCEILHEHDLPLSRLSATDLPRQLIQEPELAHLSHGSLARMLAPNALKPWQYRYWLFPRDPDFARKAGGVLELYAGFWEAHPLTADEYVLSADEQTSQGLVRPHARLPPQPGPPALIEFEYERLGTSAYHAAWDVHRGQLYGRVAPNPCMATFQQLVALVMPQEPSRSAARVFWIVAGGSAHYPNTFPARLAA